MPALEQGVRERRDRDAAWQSATQICYVLKEHIPDSCFRRAIDDLAEAMLKAGIELTNAQQRKQYEAMHKILIDPTKMDFKDIGR